MMKNHFHLLAAALLALASSCSGCFGCVPPGTGDGGNLPSSCVTAALTPEAQKLDVLFVIDNSSSMREEQEGVARELTAFIDELKKGGGVAQDFNIGVITTAVYQHTFSGGIDFNREYPGQSGKLQAVPDSELDGGVILGTGTERVLNGNDPALVTKFARLVQQGTRGSGQETP
ncbi:MAG: putative lipoprotein, partial [Myxococcaceae bacterium]|nr:putative lipoprotein [Myxococcaceae bacterium]